MILQALTRYYEDLLSRGEIDAPGWTPAKISYALCLDGEGQLTQVIPTMEEVTKGKKTVLQPQVFPLPAAVKRTVGIDSNFLWDNSSYLLGVDQKGKPERSRDCFAAAAQKHLAVLDGVDSPAARAILAFFDTWQPEHAAEYPVLAGQFEEVTAGANLLFRVDGCYPQKDAAIREAWQKYRESSDPDAVRMQCLVTGREDEITATHPAIKGVRDAQSSGAALVSFNALAFCSYGREQNYNAPVGKYAAFAYTAALNHLLEDRNNVQLIGDTTVVCWAEGADPAYQSFAMTACFGAETGLSDDDLRAALKRLADGLPCDDLGIDPERPFYILGLAPNAARLSVRFFLRNSFGALMKNVNDHYERMEIVRPAYKKFSYLPLWAMLQETVNLNSRDKSPSPVMAGAAARAVFSGGRYPASLLEAVMLRIRAERNITWGRAAIIKAYYLKNPHKDCPEEVLTMSLNEASTNPAYTLGRLFSIYEAVQQAANPGINATIKDKYFNSAAAMPSSIFPVLNNLYQKHLRKLEQGQRVYYDKQVSALKGVLGTEFPARMTLAQQGSFDLGYYHQTQKRYTKKGENENV
jgi:CRISPR-associated protein, csd1 family